MNITPITNGLSLSDVCSQPCCGCEELEALKGIARQFGDNATTLQNFANRLSGEVSQMNTIVLGSRLGDAGCTEC